MYDRVKLVFLVISADSGTYGELQRCWQDWAAQNHTWTRVYYVYGDPDAVRTFQEHGNRIITPRVECLVPGVLDKTVDALQFLNEKIDYDFLIRTNLSSFWLNENILGQYFSKQLTRNRCYAGYIGMHAKQLFVSGAGIIMSPDVIAGLIARRHCLARKLPDDVAIGRLIQEQRLAPLNALQNSRHDITTFDVLPDNSSISGQLENICGNNNLTHVRLKNPERKSDIIFFREMLEMQRRNLTVTNHSTKCRI